MTLSLIVLILAFLGLRAYMPNLGSSAATGIQGADAQPVLGDCPGTPNCQCSEASREEQRVDRFAVTPGKAEAAIATMADILRQQPGMDIVTQSDQYLHATYTSKLMRYVDDIEFLLSADGSSLQVRSASRLGKSDLGANAKRVAQLREAAAHKL